MGTAAKACEATRNGSRGGRTARGWLGRARGPRPTAAPTLPACVPCRPDGPSREARRGVKAAFLHLRSPELRDTGCTARVRPAVGALGPGARLSQLCGRGRDFTTVRGGPARPCPEPGGGDLLATRSRKVGKGFPTSLARRGTRGGDCSSLPKFG